MTSRADRTSDWWDHLPKYNRHLVRMFAELDGDMPKNLFLELVEAHVLSVSDEVVADARRGGQTFPFPKDIRAFVLAQPSVARPSRGLSDWVNRH